MPLPTPNPNEKQADFIERCMKFLLAEDSNRDQKQALAICYSQWRHKESMHPDFTRVYDKFKKQFGEVIGVLKFEAFIEKNKLDTLKPYLPNAQFYESFGWAKPLIQFMRQDKDAKYYAVRALTAGVSMKGADWSNYDKMTMATPSMNYRPLNYMHNHSTWLPFPRTRVDYAKADDFSVEATLRVDNQESLLQKQLDHDPSIPEKEWINSVSIEARSEPDGNYHFTALALIPSGKDLPGDPCTEIFPIAFNESIGQSICNVYNGKLVCECQKEVKETMSTQKEENVNAPEIKPKLEELNETIMKKDRENARLLEQIVSRDERIKALEESLAKAKTSGKENAGRLLESQKQVADRDVRIDSLEKDLDKFREDIGRLTEARENAISEKNEALSKAAKDAERANQEILARASIQRECSDLRESMAKVTREYADLTQKRSDDAKNMQALQEESMMLKTEIENRKKADGEKQQIIERLETMNKKSHKLFQKYGIYEVDDKGNLNTPV